MGKLTIMAWRNMWRNWRRTAIALVAIVLGLILLLFMDGMIKGSDQAIFGNAVRLYGGNLQVHAPGFRTKAHRLPLLPLESADAVVQAATAHPQIAAATPRINTSGMVSLRGRSHPVAITGIEPELEAARSIQAERIVQGRFLQPDDSDALVIGKGLADLLGVSAGDRVTLLGRRKDELLRRHSMTVVGVYDLGMTEVEKGMVFITLAEAQTLYNLRDQATEAAIFLRRAGQEQRIAAELGAALPGYEVDSWETLRPEMRQTMETKGVVTSIIGFVVLLIAAIGVLNLMLMAVFERTREMGILAALGMKGRQVMFLFLIEGALIGAVGAVIGGSLGLALLWAFSNVGMDISFVSGMGELTALMGDRIYPAFSPATALSRGLAVTFIAALAALYPAWQAARREPAVALHHV